MRDAAAARCVGVPRLRVGSVDRLPLENARAKRWAERWLGSPATGCRTLFTQRRSNEAQRTVCDPRTGGRVERGQCDFFRVENADHRVLSTLDVVISRSHAARLLASWYTVRAARTNASRVFHEKHDGACDLARGAERTGPAASAAGVRRRPGGGGADRGGLPRACWHQRHGRVGLPIHRRRGVRRGELLRRGHGRGGLLGGRAQLPVDQRWR